VKAAVFDAIVAEALAGYDKIIGLDLSDVAVDGSLNKSPCGGEGTGKNPERCMTDASDAPQVCSVSHPSGSMGGWRKSTPT